MLNWFADSARRQRSPGPLRRSPVDPLEQHRQLRRGHRDPALRRRRPNKSTPFQALAEQAGAPAVEPDHLYQVAPPAAEHEQVARVGGLPEDLLGQGGKERKKTRLKYSHA